MLKQQLQQKQLLRLAPQQVLVAKLLEAPSVELENIIKQNMEENPALEETGEVDDTYVAVEEAESESSEDLIRADYFSDDDVPDYRLQSNNYSKDEEKNAFVFSDSSTLLEGLIEQLHNRELTDKQFKIGEYIIGNIDPDGYLRRSLQQVSDDLIFSQGIDASVEELEYVLDIIHDFDPPGIAARNLRECLLIQIESKKYTPLRENAYRILDECFDAFCNREYEQIEEALSISREEIEEAIKIITKLNPKPTNGMGAEDNEKIIQIIPDFEVSVDDNNELTVSLINSRIPELHVSRSYTEMVEDYNANPENRSSETKATITYIKQKLDAASGFILAIKQRQETLMAIMKAIVEVQHSFFLEGDPELLKPLKLKDISIKTGYDISTISRVTNNKYVQTQYGIFLLKYFFKEILLNDRGEEISVKEIEDLIKGAIASEDHDEPLNDTQLSNYLKEKGYTMARRTVVKYRQQLNIPNSKERRENYLKHV